MNKLITKWHEEGLRWHQMFYTQIASYLHKNVHVPKVMDIKSTNYFAYALQNNIIDLTTIKFR